MRRTRDRARASLRQRNALSRWQVTRPAGGGSTDPETGVWTPATTPVWAGAAHFYNDSRPHVRVRSDAALTIEGPTLCVVASDAARLKKGDTVTAVDVDDSSLLDRFWRITGEPASSYARCRHYPLEEVTP